MSADNALRLRLLCDDIDVDDLLQRIAVPTLVIRSRYDSAVPLAEGQRLASMIPGARLLSLESANHLPLPEEPAWPVFIREVEAFIRE